MVMDDKGAQRPCWKVSELLVKALPERRKLGHESFRQEAPRWGREQCTLVLFFPKDKQNVGTVWHCHQCQDLALVRLGCRHSLTRRSNHHSHSGSNGQECGMGKAGVAAAPAFPKALCTRGWLGGAALCSYFLLRGVGHVLTRTLHRPAKPFQTFELFTGDSATKEGSGHLWRDACSP